MRAVPATWEKSWNPARRRCTSPASLSWAPSHVTGTPIVTLPDNSEQARQGGVPRGCAVVSVLAGQVDIAAIGGMFLRSPAPGQQVREVGRAVTAPRGGRRAGPAHSAVQSWLGGGLDPGGAWAPSRQRRAIPLPTGCAPVRRDSQALFPFPSRAAGRPVRATARAGHARAGKVRSCGAKWRLLRRLRAPGARECRSRR
jgi:hypothetical protein